MRLRRRSIQGKRAPHLCAAPFACRLVIMAKVPVAGRVKTRLAREIGIAEATRFYRATSQAVIARLGRQPFWETIIAVDPDGGVHSPMLPGRYRRMPQGGGDLGLRMHRPMRQLPPGPVCVIGTDIPSIDVGDVRKAFRALGRSDAMFGPAEDGGFWLVGFGRRRPAPYPYAGVAWSRSDTLAAVLANIKGASVGFTTTLHDVDNATDLARTRGVFGRRIASTAPSCWDAQR